MRKRVLQTIMNSKWNDNTIVQLFRQQDAGATRELYNRFYRLLCYYAQNIIHQKQEAEDIAVEAFLKLLQKRNDFYRLSDIRSFLYTATRNACIDFYRKQKRHQQSHSEIEYLSADTVPDNNIDVINAEVLATLYYEIENLPPQCAQVFKLYFFERFTTEQVAQHMGISNKTALNQKGKAIQLLRNAILQKGMLPLMVMIACSTR